MAETDPIIVCPKCGSTDVSKPAFTMRSLAIGMLLLGMPIPFMRKQCHCFDCRLDFPLSKSGSTKAE